MVNTDGADPIRKDIPDKLYFKIGEVCKITGVKQHALRYWETEFKVIRPQRATSKQRLYRRIDVENILKIKKLLREDGYSVAGAKKILLQEKGEESEKTAPAGFSKEGLIENIKSELRDIKKMVDK